MNYYFVNAKRDKVSVRPDHIDHRTSICHAYNFNWSSSWRYIHLGVGMLTCGERVNWVRQNAVVYTGSMQKPFRRVRYERYSESKTLSHIVYLNVFFGGFFLLRTIVSSGSDCHVHQNKKMNFLNGRYREFHSEIKIGRFSLWYFCIISL